MRAKSVDLGPSGLERVGVPCLIEARFSAIKNFSGVSDLRAQTFVWQNQVLGRKVEICNDSTGTI